MESNQKMLAFVNIRQTEGSSKDTKDRLFKQLRETDYIKKVYELSGDYDLTAIVEANSVPEMNSYIDKIREYQGVGGTTTYIVLNVVKD